MGAASPSHSFLDLVNICDNFSIITTEEALSPWLISTPNCSTPSVIGLIRPEIVKHLRSDNERRTSSGHPAHWDINDEDGRTTVQLSSALSTPSQRSAVMRLLCEGWRDAGLYPGVIGPKKWRDEMYAVYYSVSIQ
jgi:hypothetical protein